MSETLYRDIRAALANHLNTMTGVIAVAWENVAYTPTVGTPYLRPTVLMGQPRQAAIGDTGPNEQVGVYQIDLFYPPGKGTGDINAMAGKIEQRFKRGTKIAYNGVTLTIRSVYLSAMQQGADWVQLPVNITFYTFTDN